jgi:hypothetical protein
MIAEFGQRKRSFLAHCRRSIPTPFKVSFASKAVIQQAYWCIQPTHAASVRLGGDEREQVIMRTATSDYPSAIARVARIGNFKVLHNATKFSSRGRVRPCSQR